MPRLYYRPCLESSVEKCLEHPSLEDLIEHYEFLSVRDRSNFEVIHFDNPQSKCRYYFDVDYKSDKYTSEEIKQLCCETLAQFHLTVIFIGNDLSY